MTSFTVLSEIFNVPISQQTVHAAQVMPGAGGVGGLCGFVSGGLMFIGAWGGYFDIPRTKLRPMSQRFSQAITERFGSLHCQELRGDCAVLAVELLNLCVPILAEEIEKVDTNKEG